MYYPIFNLILKVHDLDSLEELREDGTSTLANAKNSNSCLQKKVIDAPTSHPFFFCAMRGEWAGLRHLEKNQSCSRQLNNFVDKKRKIHSWKRSKIDVMDSHWMQGNTKKDSSAWEKSIFEANLELSYPQGWCCLHLCTKPEKRTWVQKPWIGKKLV